MVQWNNYETGTRAATGKDWDIAVEKIIERYREKHGINTDNHAVLEKMRINLKKYAAYLESKKDAGINA